MANHTGHISPLFWLLFQNSESIQGQKFVQQINTSVSILLCFEQFSSQNFRHQVFYHTLNYKKWNNYTLEICEELLAILFRKRH